MLKMKKISIPALEFFEFKSSDELADSALEFIKNSNLVYNKDNVAYAKEDIFFYEPLFDWLDTCIHSVENELQTNDGKSKWSLKITDSWVNRQNLGQLVQQHHHSLSLMSAIYYLDNAKTSTKFLIPNYSFHDNGYFFATMPKAHFTQEIYPEKGKLVIFPSHLKHHVDPHRQLNTRYTIAFNMFLSGTSEIDTARLQINIKDVRTQYYEYKKHLKI